MYKSAMQHISELNLSSFRCKVLRQISESMYLLIDVLLTTKRICHCVTKAIKSPFLGMNNLIIKYVLRRYYLCSEL